ncbi:MAG: hypothetical protein H6865_06450 [Rhodospirillales bacterium]|nr:hypothetical protein [Alphaproteobacteria bacterium]MCB9987262.1 hypothetical protein [Rhodospirillales bacterium]USO07879.1 MAG: hypothetical protein H6866_01250 [Rhodospirillales bacterium]
MLDKPHDGVKDAGNFGDMVILRDRKTGAVLARFSEIVPHFAQGSGRKCISEAFPGLQEKGVKRLRGLFRARVMQRPDRSEGGVHILCDENVSTDHIAACQRILGYASGIHYEGLQGRPDRDVWDHAVACGFNVIVTRDFRTTHDGDLTSIAKAHWRDALIRAEETDEIPHLPLLLHLTGKAERGRYFGKIAACRRDSLVGLHASLEGPVMHLNEDGLHVRVRWMDLLRPDWQRPRNPGQTLRQQRRALSDAERRRRAAFIGPIHPRHLPA